MTWDLRRRSWKYNKYNRYKRYNRYNKYKRYRYNSYNKLNRYSPSVLTMTLRTTRKPTSQQRSSGWWTSGDPTAETRSPSTGPGSS